MCETLESGTDDVKGMREGNGGDPGERAGGDVLPFPVRRPIRRHWNFSFFEVLMFLSFNKSGYCWVQNDAGFWRFEKIEDRVSTDSPVAEAILTKIADVLVGVIVRSIILEERSQDCEYEGWPKWCGHHYIRTKKCCSLSFFIHFILILLKSHCE